MQRVGGKAEAYSFQCSLFTYFLLGFSLHLNLYERFRICTALDVGAIRAWDICWLHVIRDSAFSF